MNLHLPASMPLPRFSQWKRRGFTLVEMTLAMTTGAIAATMMLALTNQQITFLQMYRAQSFLTEEAPLISAYMSRILGSADSFRLHDTVADALAGTNSRTGPTPVLALTYAEPDGTERSSILSFEDIGDGPALYYYVVPTSGVLGAPEWAVTTQPTNVEFFIDQGVLRMTLTGPSEEQITYSGSMQK